MRTWLLADDGLMSGEPRFVSLPDSNARPARHASPRPLSPDDQEMQQRLVEALTAARGNVTEAARALGKGRVQITA